MREGNAPLVSVILPVYNVEKYLGASLDSVVNQTLCDIEIICVDDGSTDTSSVILEKYAENDSRIHIIKQENKGLSETRNTGARAAQGKYLYFMDSDDILDRTAMEFLSRDMEERNLEFICFNAVAFGEDEEHAKEAGNKYNKYFCRALDESRIYTGLELFSELKKSSSFVTPVWTCMIQRSFFFEKDLWFIPGIFHEDEPWMFAALMKASRAGCMNRIFYYYRKRADAITETSPAFRHAYGSFVGCREMQKIAAEVCVENPEYKKIILDHMIDRQKSTINKYRQCPEEEKQKAEQLPTEEKILFDAMIGYPASLQAQRVRLDEEKKKLQQELKKERKNKGEIEKKLSVVKDTRSYKIGRAITFVPRKCRTLLSKGKQGKQNERYDSKKNCIQILPSEVSGNRIQYCFKVSGEWKSCFQSGKTFEITCPFDVENIPESIRIIPLLSQVLPASWVCDAEVRVPVCDDDFYQCLENVKNGYRKMYPMIRFDGRLAVENLEHNQTEMRGTLCCFSGGVDALNTALAHLEENPALVSLWGCDVTWKDKEGWAPIEQLILEDAGVLNLESLTVRTSFRDLLSESKMSARVKESKEDWWHGFQHGLGILGHMALVAWAQKKSRVYIASSNVAEDYIPCASDPSIDNCIHFCGARVEHDGFEVDRQQKVQRILSWCEKKGVRFQLHVCWEKRGGENCCHCEKCWRTMLALWAEDADPREYGFQDFQTVAAFSHEVENSPFFYTLTNENYHPFQKRLWLKYSRESCPEELRWFYDADLKKIANGELRLHHGKLMRTAFLLGTPEHKNIGDQCIAQKEIEFLSEINPDLFIYEISEDELEKRQYNQLDRIPPGQTVFLHGGGNLGNLWSRPEKIRKTIISKLNGRHPIVIFPQSICFTDDEAGRDALKEAQKVYRGDQIVLCCRDGLSYAFAREHFTCRSILVPDMVMWSAMKALPIERFGSMTLFRQDLERSLSDTDRAVITQYLAMRFHSIEESDTVLRIGGRITKENRQERIAEIVNRIAAVECVVTDRLHGMVLCAVTGTPCVVLGNSYHKVESCYKWLEDLDYIRYISDVNDLEEAIEIVCSAKNREYPEKEMQTQFKPLIDIYRKSNNDR